MKDIFEELEAEVDQNVVNRKHDEIERKNLLIANDNLIVDCLSKEVFYIATNSELTVSRFTKMHDAHTVVQARCLKLEAELSKLRDKIQTDDHNELVNRFSNLEVNHLNLQLKYQNLKESFGNNPPPPARKTPDFDSVFVIRKMKASLQGNDNVIKKLKMQISQLKETRSEADCTLDFRTFNFQITQLTKKVTTLQEQNELFRAENRKIKQHYKELYDSIKITRAKHIKQTTALLTENENLKAQIHENLKCNTMESVKPRALAPGRTDHPLGIWTQAIRKLSDGEIALRSSRNLHDKFIVIVRFMNDHFGAIMGYGDYVISDSMISRVYYVKDWDTICFLSDNFVTLIWKLHSGSILATFEIRMAEAVATACYTQNRSLIHTLHNKTLYELVHDKKPDLTFFCGHLVLTFVTLQMTEYVFGKLQLTADIGIFVGYAPSRKGIGPAPTFLMPGHISSGLVLNLVPASPYVPPIYKELEILFQPMFDVDTWRTSTLSSSLPSRVEGMGSPAPAVQFQFLVFFPGVNSSWEDNPFAPVVNDPFINVFAPEPSFEASSSGDLLSTRKQLATDALWCLYNSVPSKVKPKNFKSVITKDSKIVGFKPCKMRFTNLIDFKYGN
ncbi:retrovirus-related pol polyprotein from transposon TNT 1-94 [Tanacetum coccineum]